MGDIFWDTVGNAAKVAGVVSGLKGVYDTYQALGSPKVFLRCSGEMLDKIKLRLQDLTPQRREEIEQNMASGNWSHKSIHDLELKLGELSDMHCRLCKWFDDANIVGRHLPFTTFRQRLVNFQTEVKELLNDTLNTTVPDVGNIMFGKPGQVIIPTPAISSSEAPDVSPTDLELPRGAVSIPMTPL